MTSRPPLQLTGILLLTLLPVAECQDGAPLLSVGGVLVMIVFTCCLCMCYRRMYEHRMAMAEAAHAPRAVIITTCQTRRPSGSPTSVASPGNISRADGIHMPYSPSPHFNPYAPRSVNETTTTTYGYYDITAALRPPRPTSPNYSAHAQIPAQVQLPPPSYESLFPAQNTQINSGNQPHNNDGNEAHK